MISDVAKLMASMALLPFTPSNCPSQQDMNRVLFTLTLLVSCADLSLAQEASKLQPADRPIAEVVDYYIDARLRQAGIGPAEQAAAANVLRRTMLDLVGRIPTAAEAKHYVADETENKRESMVDHLLATSAFTRHQANELSTLLMGSPDNKMIEYLKPAVGENRPWDQIFRELIAADNESTRHFIRSRVKDLDQLTNDMSVVFFGVNVSCAQCHDHPLVSEWTQAHFFGMKSFFNRTFEHGDHLGEREYGLVSYKTTAGEDKTAPLMFLTGTVLDEPEEKKLNDEEKKKWEREGRSPF